MRFFLLFFSSYIVFNSFSQNACPINLDVQDIKDIDKSIDIWHGKAVAFEAVVTEIKKGNVGKPFYKVSIKDDFLWVAGHGRMNDIKIGKRYRILGILSKVSIDDNLNRNYNIKKYFVLSLASIDMESKVASVFPAAKNQYDEWTKGKIPEIKK